MADCTVCGKPAGPLMSMCQACIDESRARARAGESEAVTQASARAAVSQPVPGNTMLGWGVVLVFAGLAVGLHSYLMDTTVAGGQYSLDRVHNLGLLSTRVELAIFAGFLFLGGLTLVMGAEIVGQIYRSQRPNRE